MSDKKMKKEVSNFVRFGGGHQDLSFTAEEYFEKLPILKTITREPPTTIPNSLCQNANWFWCESNLKNRIELANAIINIRKFDCNDKAYGEISSRFSNGDAFGIVKPVKRVQPVVVDECDLESAFQWYVDRVEVTFAKKYFLEDEKYKVVYCYNMRIPFFNALSWQCYEELLGFPLSFVEYQAIDETFYGAPEELKEIYPSEDYKKVLDGFFLVLSEFRSSLENTINKTIDEMKAFFSSGNHQKGFECWMQLRRLHEVPDGTETLKRRKAVYRYKKRLESIPGDVLAYYKEMERRSGVPAFSAV